MADTILHYDVPFTPSYELPKTFVFPPRILREECRRLDDYFWLVPENLAESVKERILEQLNKLGGGWVRCWEVQPQDIELVKKLADDCLKREQIQYAEQQRRREERRLEKAKNA